METSELLKKVRSIEIKTKGLSRNILAGEYHSAFKGRGMAFSEVREYQPGDEIRTIDWKVTARFNHPYIKVFEEERELTLMLIIDISGSESYGSHAKLKREVITEISAVLAFSAIQNNDKIGIILFTDQIEKFIPPKKGRSHVLRIIRELLDFKPQNSGTNISQALKYFTNIIKKRSTAFLISDFVDHNFNDVLKSTRNKHDLIGINISDPIETQFPKVGMIQVQDAETGKIQIVDTSSKKFQNEFTQSRIQQRKDLKVMFSKAGIDYTSINTNESYVTPLVKLFKSR